MSTSSSSPAMVAATEQTCGDPVFVSSFHSTTCVLQASESCDNSASTETTTFASLIQQWNQPRGRTDKVQSQAAIHGMNWTNTVVPNASRASTTTSTSSNVFWKRVGHRKWLSQYDQIWNALKEQHQDNGINSPSSISSQERDNLQGITMNRRKSLLSSKEMDSSVTSLSSSPSSSLCSSPLQSSMTPTMETSPVCINDDGSNSRIKDDKEALISSLPLTESDKEQQQYCDVASRKANEPRGPLTRTTGELDPQHPSGVRDCVSPCTPGPRITTIARNEAFFGKPQGQVPQQEQRRRRRRPFLSLSPPFSKARSQPKQPQPLVIHGMVVSPPHPSRHQHMMHRPGPCQGAFQESQSQQKQPNSRIQPASLSCSTTNCLSNDENTTNSNKENCRADTCLPRSMVVSNEQQPQNSSGRLLPEPLISKKHHHPSRTMSHKTAHSLIPQPKTQSQSRRTASRNQSGPILFCRNKQGKTIVKEQKPTTSTKASTAMTLEAIPNGTPGQRDTRSSVSSSFSSSRSNATDKQSARQARRQTTVPHGPRLQTQQRVVDRTRRLRYTRRSLSPPKPIRPSTKPLTVPQGPNLILQAKYGDKQHPLAVCSRSKMTRRSSAATSTTLAAATAGRQATQQSQPLPRQASTQL